MAINANIVNRKTIHSAKWPENGELYRGGTLSKEHIEFFTKEKKFAWPAYISTFKKESTARSFINKAYESKDFPSVLWVIHIDRVLKCTDVIPIQNEDEVDEGFIFSPYAVFTVLSVKENLEGEAAYEIHLSASFDKKCEPETLPLCPWH